MLALAFYSYCRLSIDNDSVKTNHYLFISVNGTGTESGTDIGTGTYIHFFTSLGLHTCIDTDSVTNFNIAIAGWLTGSGPGTDSVNGIFTGRYKMLHLNFKCVIAGNHNNPGLCHYISTGLNVPRFISAGTGGGIGTVIYKVFVDDAADNGTGIYILDGLFKTVFVSLFSLFYTLF
jgi:hypothetical protein